MLNHKNNSFLITVTILLTVLPVILNRKTFPPRQTEDIYTTYSTLLNSLQIQNVFDLSYTITTPSFNITLFHVKPIFLFPENYTSYPISEYLIELYNQTVSFFFNISLTSLNVKQSHFQYASLLFKSLHASQKYTNFTFIRKPDKSFYAEIYPNYDEFTIQWPQEWQHMSRYNEINAYLINNTKNICDFMVNIVNVALNRTLNVYPESESEFYFALNCDYMIKFDYFSVLCTTATGVVTKAKVINIKYKDKERKGKEDGYIVYKNVEMDVVYIEEENGRKKENKGWMEIKEFKYGANIFETNDIRFDTPVYLPVEIITRFRTLYEILLIDV